MGANGLKVAPQGGGRVPASLLLSHAETAWGGYFANFAAPWKSICTHGAAKLMTYGNSPKYSFHMRKLLGGGEPLIPLQSHPGPIGVFLKKRSSLQLMYGYRQHVEIRVNK